MTKTTNLYPFLLLLLLLLKGRGENETFNHSFARAMITSLADFNTHVFAETGIMSALLLCTEAVATDEFIASSKKIEEINAADSSLLLSSKCVLAFSTIFFTTSRNVFMLVFSADSPSPVSAAASDATFSSSTSNKSTASNFSDRDLASTNLILPPSSSSPKPTLDINFKSFVADRSFRKSFFCNLANTR